MIRSFTLYYQILICILTVWACEDESTANSPQNQQSGTDIALDMMSNPDIEMDMLVNAGTQAGQMMTWDATCLMQTPHCLHMQSYQNRMLDTTTPTSPTWQWVDATAEIEWQEADTIMLNADSTSKASIIQQRVMRIPILDQASSIEVKYQGIHADRMLQFGYQSWSFSGAVTIPSEIALDSEGHLLADEGRRGDSFYAEHGVSYNAIAGQMNDQGKVWLLAGLDTHLDIQAFALQREESMSDSDDTHLTIRIGVDQVKWGDIDREQIHFPSEYRFVWIVADDMWQALRAYRQQLKQVLEQQVESSHTYYQGMKNVARKPIGGWFSWNENFEDIDEDLIRHHIEKISNELLPKGLPLVEIDDGWQQGWGVWESNEKFPNGLNPLIQQAHEKGLAFGLWMAPFLVDIEVADQYDPQLFVQSQGEPLRHTIIGNPRTYYVLDGTQDEAMKIATNALRQLSMQGVDFFKLDFLYAGALPGERSQAVTGSMALQLGLQKIRRAIGDDRIINGCGAPIHSIIGWADSLRIGADTTFGDLEPAFMAWAARSLAARAYLYPLVWPDADQVQVRAPYSITEAEVGAYIAALAGSAYSLGDDLTRLEANRLSIALSDQILNLANATPARPVDLMQNPADKIYANPLVDQIQNPNFTGALPASHFVTSDVQGQVWHIQFDWNATEFQVQSMMESNQ